MDDCRSHSLRASQVQHPGRFSLGLKGRDRSSGITLSFLYLEIESYDDSPDPALFSLGRGYLPPILPRRSGGPEADF